MNKARIQFDLGFGLDQKPLITHLLDEMIDCNIDIKYTVIDFEEGCLSLFNLDFPNGASIYAFGHKQGLLSSDPSKIMEILSKNLSNR